MKHLLIAISAACLTLPVYAADTATPPPPAASSKTPPGNAWGPGPKNNPGWNMMTPEERERHMQKMHDMKNMDECKAYMDEHHKQMTARAKEKNQPAPPMKGDPCMRMQSQGMLSK